MKRWDIKEPDLQLQKYLSDNLNISPIIAQLLLNRTIKDINEAKAFLSADISELYDPFLMKGIQEAVLRIRRAIENRERILIHGDYDVDGITAIALLVFTLRNFGIEPVYYVPDRLSEGYGLSEGGVVSAIETGATLVVTVDCGISSYEEVKELNKHNIDVIITDHHEVPEILPPAYSIINPHQKDCSYPDKNLAGVSIAFKLCEALILSPLGSLSADLSSEASAKEEGQGEGERISSLWTHLDLVALGTVSDVASLTGENRILVKEGLKLFDNGSSKKGIQALIEVSGLKKKEFGSFELGFILGPRINATGRLGSPEIAVELLLTDDEGVAGELAKRLNTANRERQKIEQSTLKEVVSKIDREINFKDDKVIVLDREGWHTGVLGIVASRISDRFYRPCILISTKDGMGKGSGRSIENFHLFEALTGCGDFLDGYGGHKYACGLTILEKNLTQFKKTMNEIAKGILTADDMVPHLDIDMEIPLSLVDHKAVEDIAGLEPFGEGNPRPRFCSRNLHLVSPTRVIKGEHIKMRVSDGKKSFEAIGFGLAKDPDIELTLRKSPEIDLVYSASFNTWQGIESIQLRIEDIHATRNT